MKCQKPFPAATDLTDELGGRRVIRFRPTTPFCAPASGSPVAVTTTSTLPARHATSARTRAAAKECLATLGPVTLVSTAGRGGMRLNHSNGAKCQAGISAPDYYQAVKRSRGTVRTKRSVHVA
jgi:hypothetical protein